jgi:hypothetical protein
VGAELRDGQTDRQTDMTKIIVVFFCNFANATKSLAILKEDMAGPMGITVIEK